MNEKVILLNDFEESWNLISVLLEHKLLKNCTHYTLDDFKKLFDTQKYYVNYDFVLADDLTKILFIHKRHSTEKIPIKTFNRISKIKNNL